MPQELNHRNPRALQAEVKARLAAEGKLNEHGERKVPLVKAAPPAPPPRSQPMLRSGDTTTTKPFGVQPQRLSAKDKLEALPDADLIAKAKALNLNKEGASRDDLINALLAAGAEG